MNVTKQQFQSYEDVRVSGVTNMFDAKTVGIISGLDRATIIEIMKNYEELMQLYPDVRRTECQ